MLFGLLSLSLASAMIFKNLDPNATLIILIVSICISFYWIFASRGKDRHYYCKKAIKNMRAWLDIWKKAGVSDHDKDFNDIKNVISFLEEHVAEEECANCDLPKDFYVEIGKTIDAVNAKTFYPAPQ